MKTKLVKFIIFVDSSHSAIWDTIVINNPNSPTAVIKALSEEYNVPVANIKVAS